MTAPRARHGQHLVHLLALLMTAALLGGPTIGPEQAHALPAEMTVRMFVKPEELRLHVLSRVPLARLEGVALA
jgi:hypothetical protein